MKHRTVALSALFSAAVAVAVPAVHAADWPQWRGAQRDATSAEAGLLQAWPAEGPKLLWRTEQIGDGYSTPAVVGGRVYLMSNEGLEAEFVRAYAASDGKLIWSSERVGRVGNPNQRPSYPAARCTPTIVGDHLFAIGSDGDLVCLETATGRTVWRKSFRKDFEGKPGEWAYSESPLVHGELVIVTPGGPSATVVALSAKTGEVAWKFASPAGDEAGYASPMLADIDGVKQIVQFIGGGVVGLDAGTGALLWRFTDTTGRANMTTPVIHNNLVYTGGGLGTTGVARISRDTDGKWKAEKLYLDKALPQSSGGAVRVGDQLYGTTQRGLTCVDFATGKILWHDRSIGAASIMHADGRLYLHGENGDVALVEPSAEGYREKGRFTPPNLPPREAKDKAYAHPVVSDGKLFIRDGSVLLCYDVKAK